MTKEHPKMVFIPKLGRRKRFYPGKTFREHGGGVFLAAHEAVTWSPRRRPRGHQFHAVLKFLGNEIQPDQYGHC